MNYKEEENNIRIYSISNSCIFKKNDGEYGGLSNMSAAFPLLVNNIKIKSSEALYQACKFPHDIDRQKKIIIADSPFTSKMFSKGGEPRHDWMKNRIKIMRWCLRVKLAQNYYSFGELLLRTEGRSIVENSDRDTFWGAKKINESELKGINALGRLLMELRQEYLTKTMSDMIVVELPNIEDFKLLGQSIEKIDMKKKYGS